MTGGTAMLKIIMCEDEEQCRRDIVHALKMYADETGLEYDLTITSSGEELLERISKDHELLLLDIGLPKITGMNAAKLLRKRGFDLPIVFISTMTQYALEGYEVHAFGFLKKPVELPRFKRQIKEVLEHLNRDRGVSIKVQTGTELKTVNSSIVYYAEVFRHQTDLHTRDEKISCSIPLAELEKKLSEVGFFRTHKSFLINMKYVRAIRAAEVELENDALIPLSKYRKKDLLEAFAEYMEL